MEKQKWPFKIDQWFENKVWTKVPKEYATPHMFFVIGIWSAFFLVFILTTIGNSLTNDSDVCLNPDCEFSKLEQPVILIHKNFDKIICMDSNGDKWVSSTGWDTAKNILVKGYSVGDTIKYKHVK